MPSCAFRRSSPNWRQDKSSPCRRDDAKWMEFFTKMELASFWWPSQSEVEEWASHWSSTPVSERLSPDMPSPGWDFDSMIDAIFNAEYALIGVGRLTVSEAILEFDPHAWPYGGAGALRALVRSFGHQIRIRGWNRLCQRESAASSLEGLLPLMSVADRWAMSRYCWWDRRTTAKQFFDRSRGMS